RYRAEHRIPQPDGSVRWALITSSIVHDADGQPAYVLSHFHETTDVHEMAEEARATSEVYELTRENIPVAIYSVDLSGRVVDWNPAAEEMFGWRADEVPGQPIPILFDERRANALAGLERLLAGETLRTLPAVLRHRDGSEVHVVTSATVVRGPDGSPERVIAFALDVTEQLRAQEELHEREVQMRTVLSK